VPPVRAYAAFMDHNTFKIDLVNDNEYTLRAEAEGQTVESLFRTDPDYLERIGLAEADGKLSKSLLRPTSQNPVGLTQR
jgi:hypothetical protein